MGTGPGTDPNQERDEERARGKDHPQMSEGEEWGTDQNPVRETDQPFGNLRDGGPGSG